MREPARVSEPFVTTARGTEALEAARESRALDPLARRRALERTFTGEEARAALAQDDLRVRAAAKTPFAERLLYTRAALEQASTATVADERAGRFAPFASVADLGAGIGLDTIAMARAGRHVVAAERDPERVALLRHNVAVAGVADRVTIVDGDFVAEPPAADAAFLDPDRRPGGRRTRDDERYEPPAAAWPAIVSRYRALLMKLAPGTHLAPGTSPDALDGVEWVSEHGEMKETRRGYGALATTGRRALLLPAGDVVHGTGIAWPSPRVPRAGDVLLTPDPAVVLAGLVGDAAASIGARPVHPRIAVLVADRTAPWARCLVVDEVLSADPKEIRRALDARGFGDVEVRTRGVEDPADAWRRRIGVRDGPRATVVVTRGPDDRYLAIVASGAGIGSRPAGMP